MKTAIATPLMLFTLALAGCGSGGGPSGEYLGREGAFVDKLVFGPGDKVQAVQDGEVNAGTFTVEDGGRVVVNIAGDSNALTPKSDGCLDGGDFIGTYCKP